MKKILNKLSTYLMIFVMLFANPVSMVVVNALGDETGSDTPNPSVKVGQLENPGDIQVTKSVVDNGNGNYTVTFNVQSVAQRISKPLYAVVVFDRSGSMICDPVYGESNYTWFEGFLSGLKYTAADGTELKCGKVTTNSSAFTKEKWQNAIAGAQTFRNTIVNELGENAHISHITFSSDYSELGAVSAPSTDFSDASFGHPLGGTNLDSGINAAINKLNSDAQGDSNAKKVILVISDGAPDDAAAATAAANAAKNDNGIEIYAIGYETNPTTSNFLKSIATDANHYSDANSSSVAAAIQEMAEELVDLNGAEIVETPKSPFSLASTDVDATLVVDHTSIIEGQSIVTYKPISFTLTIDQTTTSGLYETNDTNNTKIVAGNETLLSVTESPSVKWTRPSYGYTINYYKDSVSEDNFLGNYVCNSNDTTCNAELSTDVTIENDQLMAKINELDTPAGYELQVSQGNKITISSADQTQNVLNVIYVKKQFEYTVNYLYEQPDGEYSDPVSGGSFAATFDEPIPQSEIDALIAKGFEGHEDEYTDCNKVEKPEKIGLSGNVVNLYYTRATYSYCINYFYDDGETIEQETFTPADNLKPRLGETISYLDHLRPRDSYMLIGVNPEEIVISANLEENEMDLFYLMVLNYTVEYYYDNVLDESKTDIILSFNGEQITEYADKTVDGYEFDKVENLPLTVSKDESKNIIKVYYKSLSDYEPIPNTGVGGVSNHTDYFELLFILLGFYVSALYIEKKEM